MTFPTPPTADTAALAAAVIISSSVLPYLAAVVEIVGLVVTRTPPPYSTGFTTCTGVTVVVVGKVKLAPLPSFARRAAISNNFFWSSANFLAMRSLISSMAFSNAFMASSIALLRAFCASSNPLSNCFFASICALSNALRASAMASSRSA